MGSIESALNQASMTRTIRPTDIIVTITGLNLTPFISSWKNLIKPAPVAGITPSSLLLDLLDNSSISSGRYHLHLSEAVRYLLKLWLKRLSPPHKKRLNYRFENWVT